MLTATGSALGDDQAPTASGIAAALRAALAAVQRLRGAEVGDKTLVDALAPLVTAFDATDGSLHDKAAAAVTAAEAGAESTKALQARLGRARPLGEKSVGVPDPGAVSLARIAAVVAAHA